MTHCGFARCDKRVESARATYCSKACSDKERARRYRNRNRDREFGGKLIKTIDRTESRDGRGSTRRGDLYERFVEAGWLALSKEHGGRLTDEELAAQFSEAVGETVVRSTVTRWRLARAEDARLENERRDWRPGEESERAKADFRFFRERYFTVARGPMKGKPPATTDFHLRWIGAIEQTMRDGGQLMILSPPRHGKSLLMAHFVIWQVVRDPDIAIIWVAGNENIARRFGSLVRDELEKNTRLIADFCGPGGGFKPSTRTGAQWRDDEFEVATRTNPQPAPTFKAVGRGGRLLSMDADLIVADDLEDNKSTMQPAQREATELWFNTDLASRKEEHTGWVVIGSRQHPEDLASKLLETGEWETIIESAHNDGCDIPLSAEDRHVECVLWPQVRTFKYLMQKRRQVGDSIFEMQYLNRPRSDGLTIFPRDVVEACRDWSRRLGDVPPGTRLIAGVDPSGSGSGFQSAVLWAVHTQSNTRFLVDLENVQGGGVVHLRSVLERWTHKYPGLVEWVVEENIVEDTLANDMPLRELKSRLGFRFIPHRTGRNKWDLRMGVPGLVPAFEDKRINLPYGDDETRGRVEVLINQFVNFTDNANNHRTSYKTDLVMAAWFPEPTIQSWQREFVGGFAVERAPAGLGSVDSLGDWLGG